MNMKDMKNLTIWFICGVAMILEVTFAAYLPKMVAPYNTREKILDPKKRPFCNAFTVVLSPIKTWYVIKRGCEPILLALCQNSSKGSKDNFTPEKCQDLVNTLPRIIQVVNKNKDDVT
ncbi:unnamed protein product [Brassicogethes aeneus]|uniref:Uncharacterized protein n=1 Tax=Brassicogethes aeneus TaxID=1431903 RepID=A0A9P0BAS1_BRAAE|nr:unnamed protein product [Brassicogethes aeneus]